MRQTSFSFIQNYKRQFGGSLLIGKRKSARPLSTKSPIHLILKSESRIFFAPENRSLEKLIRSQARKFNIRIYDFAQNWSHIHMLIKLQRREDYVKFIRSLTSIIALKIRQHLLRQNRRLDNLGKIFTLRPYTRIVSWGRDFQRTLDYQFINLLEAFGEFKRKKKIKPGRQTLRFRKE